MIVHDRRSIEAKNNINKWLTMEKYFIDNLSKANKNDIMKDLRVEFNNYVAGQKDAAATLLSNSVKPYMTQEIKNGAALILSPE